MPIQYDGRKIIRHNVINYNAYKEYEEKQIREDRRLSDQRKKQLSKDSYEEWIRWCPENFRNASIESIGNHDPDVMNTLYEAVRTSKNIGRPQSLIIGSHEQRLREGVIRPKGKTWAMYAYISELCKEHIITDPINEVYMMDEYTMMDKNTDWRDNGRFMDEVFDTKHKIIIIDNINSDAGVMKRKKYGDDAWGRFVNAADGKSVAIVMLFSGNYDDMSLKGVKEKTDKLMQNAPKAILTQGVSSI